MCRKNRSSSDSFLGRNIWDYSYRHCFHHSIYFTINSIYTLQYNQTTDSGHFAIVCGLFYKTPIVNCVQCPHTAYIDIVIQYRNIFQGSLWTYRRSDRIVPTRNRSRVCGNSDRRSETGYRSLGCLHLMIEWKKRAILNDEYEI